ncbi:O-methyltransferase-domain-containing protein [Aspergillus floccosus]
MTVGTSDAELLASSISTLVGRYTEKLQAGENAAAEIAAISSACRDLDATATPPQSWNDRIAMSYNTSAAIALLLNLGVFRILSAQREPTPIDTLAAHCRCSNALITKQTFYEFFHRTDPTRGERFDRAMQRHVNGSVQTSVENCFDFGRLKAGAVVVDVGGGKGHHCIRIAKQNPHLYFIVQDYEASGPGDGSEQAACDRISWQRHNYYDAQPVKGADVYLLSNILMDNTQSQCQRILASIADAMIPNKSVLLVGDAIDISTEETHSAYSSSMNMHMLACFGTFFRSKDDWERLFFNAAGGRLRLTSSSMIDAGRMVFKLQLKG